jgi:hypothetical protein
MMKQKKLITLILGMICFSLPMLLATICSAQEVSISIVDFTSELVGQTQAGNRQARTYKFILVLRNDGTAVSDDMIARFSDPELNTTLSFFTSPTGNITNFTIKPGESKALYSNTWPTMIQEGFSINVTYEPSNLQTTHSSANSGYKVYDFEGVSKPKTSTPGFEIVIVLLAIVVLLFLRKIRK